MIDNKLKKMRNFLKHINYFCFSKRNLTTKFGVFLFVIAFGIFIVANPVYAQGALETIGNFFIEAIARIFLVLANFFMALTIFALRYFVEVAAYNNHTLAPTVILGWTMVRDVANMFFVVILLAIAFGTILGLDQYEWKKLTVKLVLAAIFINFSKLIAGIIIDAAHIFTITFLNAIVATAGGNIINMFGLDKMMTFAGSAMNNPSGEGLMMKVLGGSVAAFLFSFIALLTIGAYAAIMLSRMLVLWVLIILSPLAYLMSVLPATKKYASEYWQEFIKYVIAGPVMVFFLWLAFATMGSGNVNQEVASHVNIENAAISNETTAAGTRESEISASLSAVTEWESMASFFIAVAFLFVGLQQVSKLGLVGGTLAGQATGLGTKWAMMATGAAAAGWLGGKALAVPGGAVKIAAKPFTRFARTQKAKAEIGIRKVQRFQAQAAKDLEGKGFLGKMAASVIEIGSGRKEKKVEDWEKTAQSWGEIKDAYLGTSSTAGGKAKLEARVRLEQAEELKGVKMSQKSLEKRAELEANEGSFLEKFNKFKETEEIIAKGGVATEIGQKQESFRKAKLKAEAYKKTGDDIRGNQIMTEEYARQSKITNDLFSGMSWEQLMAQAGMQNQRVEQARVGGDPKKLQAEIQRSVGLQTALFNQGSTAGESGFLESLKSAGWNEKEDITDDNKQRAVLTAILGKNIKIGKEGSAKQEIVNAYGGEEQANNALRLMNDSFKKAAMDGGINMMGVVGSSVDKEGNVKYKINDKIDVAPATYAAERQDIRKLDSPTGYMNLNLKGDITGISKERSGQFAEMFRGKTQLFVDQAHSAFIKKMNETTVTSTNSAQFKEMYKQVATKIADKEALNSFVRQTQTLFDQLGTSTNDIWKDAGRQVVQTPTSNSTTKSSGGPLPPGGPYSSSMPPGVLQP